MKRDLLFSEPAMAQTAAAEDALARAQAARAQGDLGLALEHALLAHARAPLAGLRHAAGLLACFCHFRLEQYRALLALGETLQAEVTAPGLRTELLRWLTIAAAHTGHFVLARRLGNEALSLAERGADLSAQPALRQALALVLARMGDPWRAGQLLGQGLAVAENQPVAYPLLATLQQLAEAAIDEAHLMPHRDEPPAAALTEALARASAHARRALAVAERVGDQHLRVYVDGLLGEAGLQQQPADSQAKARVEQALCQALAHGHWVTAWRMGATLAETEAARGEANQAIARLQPLLAAVDDPDAPLPHALQQRLHTTMAQACRTLGQADRAAQHDAQVARLQALRSSWQASLPDLAAH